MRRLRLAQLTPSLLGGGIEHRTARLLAALPRDDFELAWAGFGDVRESLIARAGRDVEVRAFPHRRPGLDFDAVRRVASFFRAWRPDVVHVHNWSASLYGVLGARLARVPWLIFGLGGKETPEAASPRRRGVMRTLALGIDHFTTVCDFLAAEIVREWGAPWRKVSVIRTGVDLARFRRSSRDEARRALSLPMEAVVFGISGVLRPVKRLEDFLAASERVARALPDAHFVLIGFDGAEDYPPVRRLAGLGGRLHLLGQVPAVDLVLPALDVAVSTSAFEGASNALIEAMASGLPVIASRVGGTPELVSHGDNGLLFDAGAVGALTEAMISLGRDPAERARLGARGLERARSDHDLGAMVTAYADLYRRTAS